MSGGILLNFLIYLCKITNDGSNAVFHSDRNTTVLLMEHHPCVYSLQFHVCDSGYLKALTRQI